MELSYFGVYQTEHWSTGRSGLLMPTQCAALRSNPVVCAWLPVVAGEMGLLSGMSRVERSTSNSLGARTRTLPLCLVSGRRDHHGWHTTSHHPRMECGYVRASLGTANAIEQWNKARIRARVRTVFSGWASSRVGTLRRNVLPLGRHSQSCSLRSSRPRDRGIGPSGSYRGDSIRSYQHADGHCV